MSRSMWSAVSQQFIYQSTSPRGMLMTLYGNITKLKYLTFVLWLIFSCHLRSMGMCASLKIVNPPVRSKRAGSTHQQASLPSCRLVRGTSWSPRAAEHTSGTCIDGSYWHTQLVSIIGRQSVHRFLNRKSKTKIALMTLTQVAAFKPKYTWNNYDVNPLW